MDSLHVVRVIVPLQNSSGIFVNGEILHIHKIHESHHIVVKEPRNGNRKANVKLTQKNIFILYTISNTTNCLEELGGFTQIIHSKIDARQRRTKKFFLNIFQKSISFWTG